MKEISRQFVVFGNFKAVTFDSVFMLDDIRRKYSFKVDSMQDIIQISQPIQMPSPLPMPIGRPVFLSQNNRIRVFFGTNRIHVEEIESDSTSFSTFNEMAIDIICNVVRLLDLKVNRIALNGSLFNDDAEWMQSMFTRFFNKSELYSNDELEEWQFRIASKEQNSEINSTVNKIVAYNKGTFGDNVNNVFRGLVFNYDYNTPSNNDRVFTEKEIKIFNNLAQDYRKLFIG